LLPRSLIPFAGQPVGCEGAGGRAGTTGALASLPVDDAGSIALPAHLGDATPWISFQYTAGSQFWTRIPRGEARS